MRYKTKRIISIKHNFKAIFTVAYLGGTTSAIATIAALRTYGSLGTILSSALGLWMLVSLTISACLWCFRGPCTQCLQAFVQFGGRWLAWLQHGLQHGGGRRTAHASAQF